jgi:1-acyl-sn-glycerol-3-phosphate acyltransferase
MPGGDHRGVKLYPYRPVFTRICRVIIGFLLRVWFRVRVRHAERVPVSGAFLLCPNHSSYADSVLMGAFSLRILRAMMLKSFYDRFPIGLITGSWGTFPVKDGGVTRETMRLAEEVLRGGHGLLIFPEGGRSRDGKLMPGRPGAMLLAMKMRAPVVPVAIQGVFEAYPPGRSFPRPGRVTLVFGEPITEHLGLAYPADKGKLPELTDLLMDRIRRLMDERD